MSRPNRVVPAILSVLALAALPAPARAQSDYKVIHHFSGRVGGAYPEGLVGWQSDPTDPNSWALYGKTVRGGDFDAGVVFKLTPPAVGPGAWPETLLYVFNEQGGSPQYQPSLIATASGALCGTRGDGPVGRIFCLSKPGPGHGYYWINKSLRKQVLFDPIGLVADSQGALYTAALFGGGYYSHTLGEIDGPGSIVKLTPQAGSWTPSVLFTLPRPPTGPASYGTYLAGTPWRDPAGVLYAVTDQGASAGVFSLTPPAASQTAWTPKALYNSFGGEQISPVIGDPSGALYGTTYGGDPSLRDGTVYRLSPPVPPSTTWTRTILHVFHGTGGVDPETRLFRAASGSLYGTTFKSISYDRPGPNFGTIFRMTPPTGGATDWSFSVLHTFAGPPYDGQFPQAELTAGPDGTLYGTTGFGGAHDAGIAFSITP